VPDVDAAQFHEYVEARMVALRRSAYLICGDWQIAEDAVAVSLAKLYVHWAKASASTNLDAYVRRILMRSIVDEWRRPWRRESPVEYVVSTGAHPPPNEDRLLLIGALAKMPPRRRAVLVLRFFEDLSVEETAEALGINEGTVKSQTARGLAAMRELLPEENAFRHGGHNA
jgi:RNA polymerase sigma-70 factor (sigma-E family)